MAKTRAPETIGCGGCDKTWTGLAKCHCAGCHETFSSLTTFDQHRHYSLCRDPEERGLELHDGIWQGPPREPVPA